MGLLIKNGQIITARNQFMGDILVEDEKIVEIAENIPEADHQIVDAKGKYVMPGGVDQHVHMGPFDTYSFETSHAALAGGTTTIVDFAPQFEGMGVIESKHKHHQEKAENIASPDYSFHGMVMNTSEAVLDEIPNMVENGISTLKFFMAYKGTPFYVEDDLIFKAMQIAKDHGITVMVHAENGDAIDTLTKQVVAEGLNEPYSHTRARPPRVEDEATNRIIDLAEMADSPIYIVHVTSEGAMAHVRAAQNRGLPVYAETCTHYLTLNDSFLAKPDFEGAKYVCAPALRPPKHQKALWNAVHHGVLNAVSSDHAAVVGGFEKKCQFKDDYSTIPNGAPGMQSRLHMLWTQGVTKKRITPEEYVNLTATQPAKNIGLDHRKGDLLPGYDADIVIFDPEYEGEITFADMYEGTDYATFEGFEKKGRFEKVFLRGHLVAENEKLIEDQLHQGQYIEPHPYGTAYNNFTPKSREEYFDIK